MNPPPLTVAYHLRAQHAIADDPDERRPVEQAGTHARMQGRHGGRPSMPGGSIA
ncbi:hypothetical protein VDGL01_12610 [Verticillium dahliae]